MSSSEPRRGPTRDDDVAERAAPSTQGAHAGTARDTDRPVRDDRDPTPDGRADPGGGAGSSAVDPSDVRATGPQLPDPRYGEEIGTAAAEPSIRVPRPPQSDAAPPDGARPDGARPERLVSADRASSLDARWNEVKGMFVDDPRQAVSRADSLIGELLDEVVSRHRRDLAHGLDGPDISTEDLRFALRRYRTFFDRLLTI